MKLFYQSLTLFASCILVILITQTTLSIYIEPILGLSIIFSVLYIVIKSKTRKGDGRTISNIEIFAVTTSLLLIIFSTGGISSNLFFLTYLLLFGVVLVFQPISAFILLLGLLAVFMNSAYPPEDTSNLVKLGSLILLSPLAYFFGNEFERRTKLQKEVKDKTGQILENIEVLKKDKQISEDALDEIEDIEGRARDLRMNNE